MRVRFKKRDLLPAAAIVQNVASQHSTLPILSNVLITTDHDNVVGFTATDYETRVKVDVAAEVDKKGTTTVPAKTFYDLIRELPEDSEVILETREKSASLRCREIKCELQTMPARDFPRWPELEPKVSFDMDQKALKDLLDKILFAVPVRDPRKVLLGALCEFRADHMSFIATDGKILAYAQHPAPLGQSVEDQSLVIAQKILAELSRTLGEGTVTVSFDERQVAFKFNNVLVVSNQVEGKYPNYHAVVPAEFMRQLHFKRAPMMSAIRRAAILSDIKNSAISALFSGESITVEAESYDKGHIEETIPSEFQGDDFKICFNYHFLSEVLKAIDRDDIVLQVNQPSTPAVMRGQDVTTNFYLIMPIKLTELAQPEEPEEEGDVEMQADVEYPVTDDEEA